MPGSLDGLGPDLAIEVQTHPVVGKGGLQEMTGTSDSAIHRVICNHFPHRSRQVLSTAWDPIFFPVGRGHPDRGRGIMEPIVPRGEACKGCPGTIPKCLP